MSPAELNITAITEKIIVDSEVPDMLVVVESIPDVIVLASGNMGLPGPPGPPGQWESLTQAEYNALDPPDPEILYVIVE
ncbi:MAG: hypothetical protein ABWY25_07635 [Paenisporosarcina sp.]